MQIIHTYTHQPPIHNIVKKNFKTTAKRTTKLFKKNNIKLNVNKK